MKGVATAAVICGSVGFGLSFLIPFLALPTSLAGLILSAIAWKTKLQRTRVALGLSIAGLAISLLFWIFIFSLIAIA